MGLVNFVLESLYLFLPGFIANMAPVFVKRVPFLDYPLDFGRVIKGKRILGSHKTFRGLVAGIIFAIAVAYLQKVLFETSTFFMGISILNYSEKSFLLIGFLLGFGALFGDALKSFFKRRFDVSPGKSWVPWDQLDFMLGMLVFILFIHIPDWRKVVFLLLVVPFLHIATNHIGFYLKIREVKW